MYKLSEEAKRNICKPLGIPVDEKEDKIIEAYIEDIDNEPVGYIDPKYAIDQSHCSFSRDINKSIDETIKQRSKHVKKQSKINEDILCK